VYTNTSISAKDQSDLAKAAQETLITFGTRLSDNIANPLNMLSVLDLGGGGFPVMLPDLNKVVEGVPSEAYSLRRVISRFLENARVLYSGPELTSKYVRISVSNLRRFYKRFEENDTGVWNKFRFSQSVRRQVQNFFKSMRALNILWKNTPVSKNEELQTVETLIPDSGIVFTNATMIDPSGVVDGVKVLMGLMGTDLDPTLDDALIDNGDRGKGFTLQDGFVVVENLKDTIAELVIAERAAYIASELSAAIRVTSNTVFLLGLTMGRMSLDEMYRLYTKSYDLYTETNKLLDESLIRANRQFRRQAKYTMNELGDILRKFAEYLKAKRTPNKGVDQPQTPIVGKGDSLSDELKDLGVAAFNVSGVGKNRKNNIFADARGNPADLKRSLGIDFKSRFNVLSLPDGEFMNDGPLFTGDQGSPDRVPRDSLNLGSLPPPCSDIVPDHPRKPRDVFLTPGMPEVSPLTSIPGNALNISIDTASDTVKKAADKFGEFVDHLAKSYPVIHKPISDLSGYMQDKLEIICNAIMTVDAESRPTEYIRILQSVLRDIASPETVGAFAVASYYFVTNQCGMTYFPNLGRFGFVNRKAGPFPPDTVVSPALLGVIDSDWSPVDSSDRMRALLNEKRPSGPVVALGDGQKNTIAASGSTVQASILSLARGSIPDMHDVGEMYNFIFSSITAFNSWATNTNLQVRSVETLLDMAAASARLVSIWYASVGGNINDYFIRTIVDNTFKMLKSAHVLVWDNPELVKDPATDISKPVPLDIEYDTRNVAETIIYMLQQQVTMFDGPIRALIGQPFRLHPMCRVVTSFQQCAKRNDFMYNLMQLEAKGITHLRLLTEARNFLSMYYPSMLPSIDMYIAKRLSSSTADETMILLDAFVSYSANEIGRNLRQQPIEEALSSTSSSTTVLAADGVLQSITNGLGPVFNESVVTYFGKRIGEQQECLATYNVQGYFDTCALNLFRAHRVNGWSSPDITSTLASTLLSQAMTLSMILQQFKRIHTNSSNDTSVSAMSRLLSKLSQESTPFPCNYYNPKSHTFDQTAFMNATRTAMEPVTKRWSQLDPSIQITINNLMTRLRNIQISDANWDANDYISRNRLCIDNAVLLKASKCLSTSILWCSNARWCYSLDYIESIQREQFEMEGIRLIEQSVEIHALIRKSDERLKANTWTALFERTLPDMMYTIFGIFGVPPIVGMVVNNVVVESAAGKRFQSYLENVFGRRATIVLVWVGNVLMSKFVFTHIVFQFLPQAVQQDFNNPLEAMFEASPLSEQLNLAGASETNRRIIAQLQSDEVTLHSLAQGSFGTSLPAIRNFINNHQNLEPLERLKTFAESFKNLEKRSVILGVLNSHQQIANQLTLIQTLFSNLLQQNTLAESDVALLDTLTAVAGKLDEVTNGMGVIHIRSFEEQLREYVQNVAVTGAASSEYVPRPPRIRVRA
jgi:hypothetical protein